MAAFVARKALTSLKFATAPRCLRKINVQRRQFSFAKCLASRLYTEKHEWVAIDGKIGTVGISNHAQEELGEIVYVESPEIGTVLQAEDVAGCVESVKAASDIYSPVAGTITEVNEKLSDNPSLVNKSPLDEGWLYKLEVASDADMSKLMDEAAYQKYIESHEN